MNKRERHNMRGLANFLRTDLPKDNWNMGDFGFGLFKPIPKSVRAAIHCNTACCVAGSAAIRHQKAWTKRYGNNVTHVTFCDFFGITHEEAHDICYIGADDEIGEKQNDPVQKAADLDRLVDKYEREREAA